MTIGNYQEDKRVGGLYAQGLFEESLTAKHRLGTMRELEDGRVFAYARAGAAGLNAGQLVVSAAPVANHLHCAVYANAAIDDPEVQVTLGATAAAKDLYKDGILHVDAGVGLGQIYKIRGHAAIGSGGSGTIKLYDKIRVALTTATSKVTLCKDRQDGVLVHPAATAVLSGVPAGVAPRNVTATYYFWNQVKGPCAVLCYGTVVLGNLVVVDATAVNGQAGGIVAAADHAALIKGGSVGTVMRVNASTNYALINLDIPGY